MDADYDTHLYWMLRARDEPQYEYIWSRRPGDDYHAHFRCDDDVVMPLAAPGSLRMVQHGEFYDIIRLSRDEAQAIIASARARRALEGGT